MYVVVVCFLVEVVDYVDRFHIIIPTITRPVPLPSCLPSPSCSLHEQLFPYPPTPLSALGVTHTGSAGLRAHIFLLHGQHDHERPAATRNPRYHSPALCGAWGPTVVWYTVQTAAGRLRWSLRWIEKRRGHVVGFGPDVRWPAWQYSTLTINSSAFYNNGKETSYFT